VGRIKVLIASLSEYAAQGLYNALRQYPELELRYGFTKPMIREATSDFKPDIITFDLRVANEKHLEEVMANISTLPKNIKIVLLIAPECIAAVRGVLEFGFRAVIPSTSRVDDIVKVLYEVAAGHIIIGPGFSSYMDNYRSHKEKMGTEPTTGIFSLLSSREKEVLMLLTEGLTNKEIAQRLTISQYTVRVHVSKIMGKLHCRTRQEAAIWAIENHFYERSSGTRSTTTREVTDISSQFPISTAS